MTAKEYYEKAMVEQYQNALNEWADEQEARYGTDGFDINSMMDAWEDGYKAGVYKALNWLLGQKIDVSTRMDLVARYRENVISIIEPKKGD